MRSWGLEEQIRAGADEVDMTMLEAPTAARAHEGRRIEVGIPTAPQSAVLSPTSALCVPQDHVEAVLFAHVVTYPNVTLRRNVTVAHVATTGAGPQVTVHDPKGLTVIAADRVVGADGARSIVRSSMGIAMVGPEDEFSGSQVEFRAPVWDVVGEHRHLLYVTTEPGASSVLIPAGQGDRWLLGLPEGSSLDMASQPTTEEIQEFVRRVVGAPEMPVGIERIGHFTAGTQVAERFARDNVFLVGDAAHRVTPRGGTGLNMAIADGRDLGWKLGWVQRGWASEALLSSYEAERRPAAEHNMRRSADELGSRRGAATELDVDLAGRVRHVWTEPGETSTLDLVGEGLTLFTSGSPAWAAAAATVDCRTPITVAPLDRDVARSFGLGAEGAQLVRPDGVPVAGWWSAEAAPDQLCAAVTAYVDGEPARPAAPDAEAA
jgi:putative polyketide hydroxylase